MSTDEHILSYAQGPVIDYAARRRFWRRVRWVLGCLGLLFTGCTAYLMTPAYRHFEKDGWVLDFHHAKIACATCTSRLDKLECNNKPVPLPKLSPDSGAFWLETPVGTLRHHSGHGGYHPYIWLDRRKPDAGEPITAAERAQGFYDVPSVDGDVWTAADLPPRPGTPRHWCLGVSDLYARWLDPALIDRLEW